MREKPDYVKNYPKPKNTEMKYINGYWYLYEKYAVYDPIRKKKRKKSGPIIGKITPEGLKRSVHRKKSEDGDAVSQSGEGQEKGESESKETA